SPVSSIRAFLAEIPAQAGAPAAWLGIRGEPQTTGAARGVRVVAVAPSSPAEKAGLKAAELIVAVDGQAIDTPDRLAGSIAKHSPGDSVKLLVFGGDKFREVMVPLQAAP
ncbi:MAG: PDZ domain-containing protein, partial [Myxococcota bacterium]|nr:PDZ domain-containing protein [Myxococcota bacterium]